VRFDRFALDLTRGCLRAGDQEIDLAPKPFEVLRHLAVNAGRLVSKKELFETVWPNVSVSDDSLIQCIRELRQKLGDNEHRLIKTVSRRGYLLDTKITSGAALHPRILEAFPGSKTPVIGGEGVGEGHVKIPWRHPSWWAIGAPILLLVISIVTAALWPTRQGTSEQVDPAGTSAGQRQGF
jgi:DNA-binding winged helix-turn-helix (wHTH) protein